MERHQAAFPEGVTILCIRAETARHDNIDNTSTFMSVLCNLTEKERIDYKLLSLSILSSIFLISVTDNIFVINNHFIINNNNKFHLNFI